MTNSKIPSGLNSETFKPHKVIILESLEIQRNQIKRFLLSEKFEILKETINGEDLLFYLKESINKPDLICMDIELPNKNGLEIFKEVRQSYPQLKIAVISSTSDKNVIQSLVQLKIDTFVKKPFTREQLIQKISQVLIKKDDSSTKDKNSTSLNLANLIIPPLPAVAIKITNFDTENPTGGSEELEKIISPDKSVTADIMKIANSAFYSRSGTVYTLKDAITLLGLKTVKNLVILQANKKFSTKLVGEVYQKNLQELPVLSALVSYDLTAPLGMKSFKEDVFLASLLRKIGMTIFALSFPEIYVGIIEEANVTKKDLLALEKESFSLDHIEIGKKVFKLWNMPKNLTDVVSHQNFTLADIGKMSHVDRITRLGGLLAYQMLGFELSNEDKEIELGLFSNYNATEELMSSFQKDYYETIKDHPFFEMLT